MHETGKKVFFSNTHGFAEVPLDTIFNVFFFNGSFRTVLSGGLKTGRSKKKKITSKTVKSQRIFQYALFFHRFTVKPQKELFSLHPRKNDWKVKKLLALFFFPLTVWFKIEKGGTYFFISKRWVNAPSPRWLDFKIL